MGGRGGKDHPRHPVARHKNGICTICTTSDKKSIKYVWVQTLQSRHASKLNCSERTTRRSLLDKQEDASRIVRIFDGLENQQVKVS